MSGGWPAGAMASPTIRSPRTRRSALFFARPWRHHPVWHDQLSASLAASRAGCGGFRSCFICWLSRAPHHSVSRRSVPCPPTREHQRRPSSKPVIALPLNSLWCCWYSQPLLHRLRRPALRASAQRFGPHRTRLAQQRGGGRGIPTAGTGCCGPEYSPGLPQDVLWLVTADGIPRRGDKAALDQLLTGLSISPRRLDLGAALGMAEEVLGPEPKPGEIILLTDLQASALSPAKPSSPLVVGRPDAHLHPMPGSAVSMRAPSPGRRRAGGSR